jgi:c-di-GMP-binding flagellar brake protein YcgR
MFWGKKKIREERRKFVRLNVLANISYRMNLSQGDRKASNTKNISMGGICFIAYEEMGISQLIEVSVNLPDGGFPINALCRVAWVNEFVVGGGPDNKKYDVGVEFIEIEQADVERINKYVLFITSQTKR